MVDKRLILAVAGSGKTRLLIENLNLEERFLIVTYTNTSLNLIKKRISIRFGYHPPNIKTYTYFQFLFNFCIKPFVLFKYKIKGISWHNTPDFTTYLPNNNKDKYLTKSGYLYHNRMSKFIEYEDIIEDVKKRLEKFYDHFFYDEFQDLGGHDFNFITELSKANINFLFVGDFFQNTYVTSFDGKVNATLYSKLPEYCKKLEKVGINIDTKTLGNSYRCSPTICSFIEKNLGIGIGSNRSDTTIIENVEDQAKIDKLITDNEVIKLVYDKSHEKKYLSKNWGECKGEDDYVNTCIILNKTTARLFKKEKLNELAPRTKNKFYVAISRTKGNCYFVDEKLII
ncbi:UvrD-helicase domain-containing protein [Draconibacterium orientale]|uniref:UvrD-helicase domain-containing protein n=1 Tax=Draconibacterium orientale TaxID=1168034 RepID=UPI002A0A971F|nr:UvrD-helicase domain-containing protein [Draconibacterium orientale]